MTQTQRRLNEPNSHKCDRLIGWMMFAITGELTRDGIEKDRADRMARNVIAAVVREMGGLDLYLPKTLKAPRAEQAAAILASWRAGANLDEIARQQQLSEKHTRALLAEARAASAAEHMPT